MQGEIPCRVEFLVQQGRIAATKGLLHDFSNVMVGLCSLSENALDETEPGSPLYDDMEIIRDSAVRSRQLINRISTLNGTEATAPTLLDLVSWITAEADTMRAILPKCSALKLPDHGRTVLVNVHEQSLRDFLLMVTAALSGSRQNARIDMEFSITETDDVCILGLSLSRAEAEGVKLADLISVELSRALEVMAEKINAVCRVTRRTPNNVVFELALNPLREA
jgi:hypothetical protein